jgi:hypothetical protein
MLSFSPSSKLEKLSHAHENRQLQLQAQAKASLEAVASTITHELSKMKQRESSL